MREVDMSAKAVTARLKQIAQLRRLAFSLRKAKLLPLADDKAELRLEEAGPESKPKVK